MKSEIEARVAKNKASTLLGAMISSSSAPNHAQSGPTPYKPCCRSPRRKTCTLCYCLRGVRKGDGPWAARLSKAVLLGPVPKASLFTQRAPEAPRG
jgi:hypothetical protein